MVPGMGGVPPGQQQQQQQQQQQMGRFGQQTNGGVQQQQQGQQQRGQQPNILAGGSMPNMPVGLGGMAGLQQQQQQGGPVPNMSMASMMNMAAAAGSSPLNMNMPQLRNSVGSMPVGRGGPPTNMTQLPNRGLNGVVNSGGSTLPNSGGNNSMSSHLNTIQGRAPLHIPTTGPDICKPSNAKE
eukprot:gene3991-4621_t